MHRRLLQLAALLVLLLVLALAWWGWQAGGLAVLQLGFGLC